MMTAVTTNNSNTTTNNNNNNGNHAISQQALENVLGSSDLDLAVLFASGDSFALPAYLKAPQNNPKDDFRSIDTVHSLLSISNARSVSQTFIAKLMGSKDSVFASIDPLPFRSLDSVVPAEHKAATSGEVPGIYESREWAPAYAGEHKDISYTPDLFGTAEVFGTTQELSDDIDSGWMMSMYQETLEHPMEYMPALELPFIKAKAELMMPKTKKASSKWVDPKVKVYLEPRPLDILFGRGGKSNLWKGNERYREIIEETKPMYSAGAKYEKTLLSQKVVDKMTEEGKRFLKFDNKVGKWYHAPNLAARRKAGQALREENTAEARAAKRRRYGK